VHAETLALLHMLMCCTIAQDMASYCYSTLQLLGVSILTFRGRAIAGVVVEAVSPMLRSTSSAEQLTGFPEPSLATIWLPILMLYMPVSYADVSMP
jgi:hypothetical protein